MPKAYKKGYKVLFTNDIPNKNIYKYFKGEIVKTGTCPEVFIFKLDRIIRLNQKEIAMTKVYGV